MMTIYKNLFFGNLFHETLHFISCNFKFLIYVNTIILVTHRFTPLLLADRILHTLFLYLCGTLHGAAFTTCAYVCGCDEKGKSLRIVNERELSLSFKNSIFLTAEIVIIVKRHRRTDDFDSWKPIASTSVSDNHHCDKMRILSARRKLFIFIFLLLIKNY